MDNVLTTTALSKQYKHTKALDQLSMHVPRGAIYGFVGRNGSGKTTLIRLLCGLQAPTSGSFRLYDVENASAGIHLARRRLGAVIETPSFYHHLSAADNLRQQYRILGLPSFADIPDLLRLVGLSDTGHKKAGNFSLGMKQRLGIAMALAGHPDFLVLDEPTNGLDPQGIIEIRELILRLNREEGITVLISSHILDELSRLATHYGIIDGGRMVKELSAAELDANCRKALRVRVSDIRALTRVLEARGVDYAVLDDHSADIYAELSVSDLVHALDAENCALLSAETRDESLESYFISLVGGERHA
ncbi:MAG: ATP-binding cassette domain-containing protein [Peptococcaceae bacterium]|nr:ATP-binding cassette domain-containing protein [Peptococcaceae bacterium]